MYFYHFVPGTCVERTAVESSTILTRTQLPSTVDNLQNLKKSGFENREKYFFLKKRFLGTCVYYMYMYVCMLLLMLPVAKTKAESHLLRLSCGVYIIYTPLVRVYYVLQYTCLVYV